MKLPRLTWTRRFIPSKIQREEKDLGDFFELLMTEAMANRASVNRDTLFIYNKMLAVGAEGDAKNAGQLAYKLVAALAAESGMPAPKTPKKILTFVRNELRGFDTPEAKERAEGARLAAIKDLLLNSKE
jgi:hypothetical protein